MRDDCAFWVGNDAALSAIKENMMSFRDPTTQDEQKVKKIFNLKENTFFSSMEILPIMNLSKVG